MPVEASRALVRTRTAAVFALVAAALASLAVAVGLERVWTLLAPSVVAALPLLGRDLRAARRLSLAAASLMALFVVLAAMSIGYLYVPSAIALAVGANSARPAT